VVLPASTWARIPRLSVRMGPHVVQGGGDLLAGHGCSHLAPFSRHGAAAPDQGRMFGQGPSGRQWRGRESRRYPPREEG
jgi:hypothetical protein